MSRIQALTSTQIIPAHKLSLSGASSDGQQKDSLPSNDQTEPERSKVKFEDLSGPQRKSTIYRYGAPINIIIGNGKTSHTIFHLPSPEELDSMPRELIELVKYYRKGNHSTPNEATSHIAEIFNPALFTTDATYSDITEKEIDLDKLAYNLLFYAIQNNMNIESVFKQFALNRIEKAEECLMDFSKLDPIEIFELACKLTRASEDENPTSAIELIIRTFNITDDKKGRERLSDFIFDQLHQPGRQRSIKNPAVQFIDAAFNNVYQSNSA